MGEKACGVVVVLSGGVGLRFGGAQPKQYLPLGGLPVVMHSILTFDAMRAFDKIMVAARREEFARLSVMIEAVGGGARVELVEGGETRTESACRAVQALGDYDDATRVLIHDAARPLLLPGLAFSVLEALGTAEAVIPGVAPTDAIVEVKEQGRCAPRRPRASYRHVQTPQGFRMGVLRQAYEEACRIGMGSWDDDASVVSQFLPGVEVVCIDGEDENFKITRASDLARAEEVLARRRRRDEA